MQVIENTSQAVAYIQSLPVNLQQELIDWINAFQEKQSNNKPKPTAWQVWKKEHQVYLERLGVGADDNEPSEQQKSFLMWRVDYEKALAKDDDWTDAEYDDYLASLKDKNDTGREVSFD